MLLRFHPADSALRVVPPECRPHTCHYSRDARRDHLFARPEGLAFLAAWHTEPPQSTSAALRRLDMRRGEKRPARAAARMVRPWERCRVTKDLRNQRDYWRNRLTHLLR